MSPEKKKQRRCDLLTTIALFLGLVFTCRLWPLLLLMMLGVFTYAIWALVENERQRAVPPPPPLLDLPAPISEQELISNAFGLLQRRITEELTRDFPRAKWVWGQTGARLCFAAGDDLVILLADAEGRRSAILLPFPLSIAVYFFPFRIFQTVDIVSYIYIDAKFFKMFPFLSLRSCEFSAD